MTMELFATNWSPWCWRVRLALEFKGLAYVTHVLDTATQEHRSAPMLKLTPRGRLPVLRDGDYVVFESVAVLYYLDREYPARPLFGRSSQEGGVILRVVEEFQNYIEPHLIAIVDAVRAHELEGHRDEVMEHMLAAASEARTIEGRLSKSEWVVGESPSAADLVIYPWIRQLQQALADPDASELATRFLPVHVQYPALARWLARIESLPGFDRTVPEALRADRRTA